VSNPVEIVIRAVDQYTPAFTGLDAALGRAEQTGRQAGDALAGVGRSVGGVAEAGVAADAALTGFVAAAGERLAALDTQRQEALAAQSAQTEAAAQALADRLLAVDEAGGAQREAARGARFTREQAAVQAQHAALLAIEQRFAHQLVALDATVAAARLETFRQLAASLLSLAQAHGGALARGAQALAIAEALISAYLAGSKALASVPFPFNLAAAAAVTAQGLATVERIRGVHIAHGGLEQVPEDATFLLQRGERVLSAPQNRDLTRFLDERGGAPGAGGAGGVVIEQLTVHVLEHATNADALLAMDPAQLRQVVSERIIPMLDDLARLGIRPRFVTDNT
jgi:hypothetical protein